LTLEHLGQFLIEINEFLYAIFSIPSVSNKLARSLLNIFVTFQHRKFDRRELVTSSVVITDKDPSLLQEKKTALKTSKSLKLGFH